MTIGTILSACTLLSLSVVESLAQLFMAILMAEAAGMGNTDLRRMVVLCRYDRLPVHRHRNLYPHSRSKERPR